MRNVVYWQANDRLVYLDEQATPEFWDARWNSEGSPAPVSQRDEVLTVTPRYLERGARILEGGCGRANKVKAMVDAGYDAIGIDFAEDTVRQAKLNYPGLDVRRGDVRSLDFPDNYFDGYWSIGVIEHFWAGYDQILEEAARVLKPEGVLFLTAPWFSPYRMRIARKGGYEKVDASCEPELFYQFALCRKEVCAKLKEHGFRLDRWQGLASEISMKEDVSGLRRPIEWLFDSRGSLVKRVLRRSITSLMNPYCGHSFLAVAKRDADSPASGKPDPTLA